MAFDRRGAMAHRVDRSRSRLELTPNLLDQIKDAHARRTGLRIDPLLFSGPLAARLETPAANAGKRPATSQ